jgi:hypothetical protein
MFLSNNRPAQSRTQGKKDCHDCRTRPLHPGVEALQPKPERTVSPGRPRAGRYRYQPLGHSARCLERCAAQLTAQAARLIGKRPRDSAGVSFVRRWPGLIEILPALQRHDFERLPITDGPGVDRPLLPGCPLDKHRGCMPRPSVDHITARFRLSLRQLRWRRSSQAQHNGQHKASLSNASGTTCRHCSSLVMSLCIIE